MAITGSETVLQRRRIRALTLVTVGFGALLVVRLGYLQVVRHDFYAAKAASVHTRTDTIPATRGEIYVRDGERLAPVALNQTLKHVYADPRLVADKAATARQLATVLGGDAATYEQRLAAGKAYASLADKVPADTAKKLAALNLKGVGAISQDYRTYPEGSLLAQTLGFVNSDGAGQYGIEQYLNDQLSGQPGKLSAKTDTNGLPIATADNIEQPPVDGQSYVLTIDRNIQAMVERELADRVAAVKAKSASAIVLDPRTGAIKAMATYPSFDPNQYSKVADYSAFANQVVSGAFEPGSGIKTFTVAAGLDKGVITENSTYNDPGCFKIDTYDVCNAAGDKPGPNKTMTVVLRDSLNTGVMTVLRKLGGNENKFTLDGKKTLYDYFTNHFGFGTRTGIELAGEAAGHLNPPSNAAGSDVNFANMSFGQGMTVTMVQMAAAMAAVANGGTLYQPYIIDGTMDVSQAVSPTSPKVVRRDVISAGAAAQLGRMLQTTVNHGSGYRINDIGDNRHYQIAGKTGTAQIPRPDGKGYIDGKNIGSFVGFAPADNPRFVIMVRVDEPAVSGYAESTTVPSFGNICSWLFKYYGIAPSK